MASHEAKIAEVGDVNGRWAVRCLECAVNELHFVLVSAIVVEHRKRGAGAGKQHGRGACN